MGLFQSRSSSSSKEKEERMTQDQEPTSKKSDVILSPEFLKAERAFQFRGWKRSALVLIAGYLATSLLLITVARKVFNQQPEASFAQSTRGSAWFLFFYYLLMLGVRFYEGGAFVLYEMLWACNTSMVLSLLGFVLGMPGLVGMCITSVSSDQLFWTIDAIAYLFTKKFVFGAARYMAKPETSFLTCLTSLHHLWFLPYCFWTLRNHGGVRENSWILGSLMTAFLGIYSRLFVPHTIPFSEHQAKIMGKKERVINVNMGHGFWADAHIDFLHRFNKSHPLIYFAWLIFVGNVVLIGPTYLGMRWLSDKFFTHK